MVTWKRGSKYINQNPKSNKYIKMIIPVSDIQVTELMDREFKEERKGENDVSEKD